MYLRETGSLVRLTGDVLGIFAHQIPTVVDPPLIRIRMLVSPAALSNLKLRKSKDACSWSPCHAVSALTGTLAACTAVMFEGRILNSGAMAVVYSAAAPCSGKRTRMYTFAPGSRGPFLGPRTMTPAYSTPGMDTSYRAEECWL